MYKIKKIFFTPQPKDDQALVRLGDSFRKLWNRAIELGDNYYAENGKFPLRAQLYSLVKNLPEYLTLPAGVAYAVVQGQDYWYRRFINAIVTKDLPAERFLPSKYPPGAFPKVVVCSTAFKQLDDAVRISLGKVIHVQTGRRFLYIPGRVEGHIKFLTISKVGNDHSKYLVEYWCK